MDRVKVVVVGGGASGVLVAVQLLRAAQVAEVVLVQDTDASGRGIAYGTAWPQHLLNVPARNMSALPDDPGHFVRFLSSLPPGVDLGDCVAGPDDFAPRMVYGEYLERLLDETVAAAAVRGPNFTRVRDRIVDIEARTRKVVLEGDSGHRYQATAAVLATGFFAGKRWDLPGACTNPWAPGALEALPLDVPILVLGTGLTMVDVALSLSARGYDSQLLAISRRGLLPNAHGRPLLSASREEAIEAPDRAVRLTSTVRQLVAAQQQSGLDWRQAIDGLRPHTQRLWAALPPVEQRRFLRHARPYWEVARHRMAPAIGERMQALLAAGVLRVARARLLGLDPEAGGVRSTLAYHDGRLVSQWFGAVVDCTGPDEDYRRSADPLVTALRARGLARAHPLGIGWETAQDGALIDAAGQASSRLFTLGPPRRGDLWESTAIPEIRVQAADLAKRVGAVFS